MDPDTMKFAMEQMAKMTPEQLAAMQRQMKDIPPSVIQEQMTLFRNLTPEQKRQAQEQARRTDPASLTAQAGQFAASAGWKVLKEAEELKAAGNKAHSSGNYAGAAQMYESANTRVQGQETEEARALQTACKLNLSSCYLNLGQFQRCVDMCSAVISSDPHNLKARYRRGQALYKQGKLQAAVQDLDLAVEVAPVDQKPAILSKLQQAQDALGAQQGNMGPSAEVPECGDSLRAMNATAALRPSSSTGSPCATNIVEKPAENDSVCETAYEEGMEQVVATSQDANSLSFNLGLAPPDMNRFKGAGAAQQLRQMAEMVRQNPALLQTMQSMTTNLSPGQLADMARASGMSEDQLDPEMTNMAMKHFVDMSPEQLEHMARMAESMPGSGASSTPPVAAAPALASNAADAGPADQTEAVAQMMQDNPAFMSQAMEMMKIMPPETMTAMAQSMQGGQGSQAVQMDSMMRNPETMKAMQSMMASMKAEDLAAMSRQAGLNLSEQEAAKLAEQMKSLTPEQMAMAVKASQVVQKGLRVVQMAKSALLSRRALAIALGVALLAVVLRCLGLL